MSGREPLYQRQSSRNLTEGLRTARSGKKVAETCLVGLKLTWQSSLSPAALSHASLLKIVLPTSSKLFLLGNHYIEYFLVIFPGTSVHHPSTWFVKLIRKLVLWHIGTRFSFQSTHKNKNLFFNILSQHGRSDEEHCANKHTHGLNILKAAGLFGAHMFLILGYLNVNFYNIF